jgi:hypothetical protein
VVTEKTLIIVPRLGRPEKVQPLRENIEENTTLPYRLLFVYSESEDLEQNEGYDHLFCPYHSWAAKLNWAYERSEEPYILCAADDLRFHSGWLEIILNHLVEGIHVVGTNDLGNPAVLRGEYSTHPFLTRYYADTYGTVDGPKRIMVEYPHVYADVEFCLTAKARGMWNFAKDSIVEHLHPYWGKGVWDRTYSVGEALQSASDVMWEKRKDLLRRRLKEERLEFQGY